MADHSHDKLTNSAPIAQKLPHSKTNAAELQPESKFLEVKQDLANRDSSVILFSVATVNLILIGPTHLSTKNLPESDTITTVIQSNSCGQLTLSEPLLLSGLHATYPRPSTFEVSDIKTKGKRTEFGVVVRAGEITVQASPSSHCKIAGNTEPLDGFASTSMIVSALPSNQQLIQTIQTSSTRSLQQQRWSQTVVA